MTRPYRANETPRDFMTEAALGVVPEHSCINKFGSNPAITNVQETVWDGGGIYVYPPDTGTLMQISSDDTEDNGTPASDTGAKTVEVFGLDTDYGEINETVTLSGQAQVPTSLKYLRLLRMIVRTAGGPTGAIGMLYAGTGTATGGIPPTIFAAIQVPHNQTHMAVYTIPAGKKGVMYAGHLAVESGRSVVGHFMARPDGEVMQSKWSTVVTAAAHDHLLNPPLVLDEKTDVELRAELTGAAANIEVHGGFDILLVPKQD